MDEGAQQQEVCYKMQTNELLDMGNTKFVQGSDRWPEEILFSCEIVPYLKGVCSPKCKMQNATVLVLGCHSCDKKMCSFGSGKPKTQGKKIC